MTSSLMLVLLMMFEARKAENWEWMWAGAAPVTPAEQLDTRLPGTSAAAASVSTAASDVQPTQAERIQRRAWTTIWETLDRDQRMALAAALHADRHGSRVDPSIWGVWEATRLKLNSGWGSYIQGARAAMLSEGRLSPQGEESWLGALEQVDQRWKNLLWPALQQLDGTKGLSEAASKDEVAQLHSVITAIALQQVEDDTVPRPDEQYAWFQLLADLQALPLPQIEARMSGEVSFLQLFRQPTFYRGRIVRIRGTARRAYRVSAPANPFGIDHYYVFWIRPAGTQLSPYLVYSLELPPRFPDVGDKGREPLSALSEPLVLSGYFFKRQAYRAQDGVRTAPVLLTKVPQWFPQTPTEPPALPTPRLIAWAIAGSALLAAGLTWLAYRGSTTRQRRNTDDVIDMGEETLQAKSVSDALSQLARAEDTES